MTPCPTPVRLAEGDGGVDGFLARGDFGPGEGLGPEDLLGLRRDEGLVLHRMAAVERDEGVDHGQVVLPREVEVALVVGRAAEDRAGAVVHQDEVGDVDREFPAVVEGVADAEARVVAALLGLLDLLLGGAEVLAFLDEGGGLVVVAGDGLRQRVVGRDADEGGAHERVGAGGVDLDPVVAVGAVDQARRRTGGRATCRSSSAA